MVAAEGQATAFRCRADCGKPTTFYRKCSDRGHRCRRYRYLPCRPCALASELNIRVSILPRMWSGRSIAGSRPSGAVFGREHGGLYLAPGMRMSLVRRCAVRLQTMPYWWRPWSHAPTKAGFCVCMRPAFRRPQPRVLRACLTRPVRLHHVAGCLPVASLEL